MASDYPGGLDDFTTIAADDKTSDTVGGRTHRDMHNDLGDAVESIEAELGTDPSGSYDTVKARIAAIEAGTLPPIDAKGDIIAGTADNTYDNVTVGANNTLLVADSTQTAGVKWANVTSAMITDGTITSTDVAAGTFAAFGTVGNLLTANQASVETDSSPFDALLNCTISRSTDHSVHGSACLKAIATADGPFIAGLDVTSFPVVPGETITATFALKADRELSDVRVTVQWATGGSAGDAVYRTVTATTSWVTHSLTVVVPPGVDTAGLFAWVTTHAPAGSEIYMDCFGVWKGAGGVWAMPGTPIVGLSEQATNGAVHLSGTGAPEGVVTAAPGSTWLQTDSTTDVKGWIRWQKATGTGSTGWVAGPEADTGWRDVTAGLTNGWTMEASGKMILRRSGGTVTLQAGYRLDGSAASSDDLYTLPTGFVPVVKTGMRLIGVGASSTSGSGWPTVPLRPVNCASPSVISMQLGNVVNEFILRFETGDGWPASLPGSAA